jgi:hypothetical protein
MSYRRRCPVLLLNHESQLIMAIAQRILLAGALIALLGALGRNADGATLSILHTSYDMGYVDPSG